MPMDSGASALAHRVKEVAAREIELAARPFHRFHPDATVWWLIPSREWPAFKFGKLFFDAELPTMAPDAGSIFCGFCVEKGLGTPLSAIRGYNPSWIIGQDWLWEQFVDSLRSTFPPLPDGTFVSIYASFFPP